MKTKNINRFIILTSFILLAFATIVLGHGIISRPPVVTQPSTATGDCAIEEPPLEGKLLLNIDTTSATTSSGKVQFTPIHLYDDYSTIMGKFIFSLSGPDFTGSDSAFPLDTIIVTLCTGDHQDRAIDYFTLQTDTMLIYDTVLYRIANTDDTLFKALGWLEFDVIDSTTDSSGIMEHWYKTFNELIAR